MPSLLRRLADTLPSWQRHFNRKYLVDTVNRMNVLADESGLTRKEIADKAGWKESYLSRILSGRNNVTLLTLARFEDAIGADVLVVSGSPKVSSVPLRTSSAASPLTRLANDPTAFTHALPTATNDYSYAMAG